MLRYVLLSCLMVCAFGRAPMMLHPRFHGRIAGGETANIEKYPYQLALFRGGYFICGASIVSETMAITAARCTEGAGAVELVVRAGSTEMNGGGTIHQVTKIHQHPGFDISVQDCDMSILEVDPPFQFGAGVGPIPLPESDIKVVDGADADVSGWGTTSVGGEPSYSLRHAIVQIVDQYLCKTAYASLTDSMICAAGVGIDPCQGDTGGPLAVYGNLIGVVSFGYGCAKPGYPGVYTRVSSLRDWIKQEVGL